MLGYADSQQLSFDRVHRYGLTGPNLETTADGWPLYSAQAEMWGQSVMALQTIHGVVAYHMLAGLPDVDSSKVVITGASGGGTQSFITAAVLPELRGAMPAVMVSTGMQGGCTCENACGLRVGTGNVEIAATIAPRPLAMTAADDWTKNMAADGFPQLKQLFGLYGAKDAVMLHQGTHFPHNYNHVARVALYGWVNRLFDLKLQEPILEADFDRLTADELTVWDQEHPKPSSGEAFERQLLKKWTELLSVKSQSGQPVAAPETTKLLSLGWDVILRPAVSQATLIHSEPISDAPKRRIRSLLGQHELGRIEQRDSGNVTESTITMQLADGSRFDIVAMDPLASLGAHQPLVNQPRPAAPYTFGYNAPQLVRRTGVALSMLEAMKLDRSQKASLLATGDDVFLALAIAYLRPEWIDEVRVDEKELDGYFGQVSEIDAPRFVPHVLRYQGLSGLAKVANAKSMKQKSADR